MSSEKDPANPKPAAATDGLSGLTVVALKQALRDRGLRVSGNKGELVQRLLAAEQEAEEEAKEEEEEEEEELCAGGAEGGGGEGAAELVLPGLTDAQWAQARALAELLVEWNGKVNVISRKDIDNVLHRHVLPTLAMAAALKIPPGALCLDVGTGGGLPGLPLAIAYPGARFLLVDARGKKIQVVRDMAERLGLRNVEARHARIQEVAERADFVVGRSVTALPRFLGWVRKNLAPPSPACPHAGIFYIKGGELESEIHELGILPEQVYRIADLVPGRGGDASPLSGSDKNVLHFPARAVLDFPRPFSEEEAAEMRRQRRGARGGKKKNKTHHVGGGQ